MRSSVPVSVARSRSKFTSFVNTTFTVSQGRPALEAAAVDKKAPVVAAVVHAVHADCGVYYFKVVLTYGAVLQAAGYQPSLKALDTSPTDIPSPTSASAGP
ncbi:MAG TPA: hypothetical protein VMF60_04035 [Acidimicrobiales bacterium]|nr:hypothetical protein [Acidimicrobiales bacterium]